MSVRKTSMLRGLVAMMRVHETLAPLLALLVALLQILQIQSALTTMLSFKDQGVCSKFLRIKQIVVLWREVLNK